MRQGHPLSTRPKLWHRAPAGTWGGQRPSMTDYVVMTGPPGWGDRRRRAAHVGFAPDALRLDQTEPEHDELPHDRLGVVAIVTTCPNCGSPLRCCSAAAAPAIPASAA
jgi:hypothetical protein